MTLTHYRARMRGTPLVPDEFHLVPSVNRDGAFGGDVSTLVAGDVYGREVRDRSVVFDATRVARWLRCQIIVLPDLPCKVALAVDLNAFEVTMGGDGMGKTQQAYCESAESVHHIIWS